MTENAHGVVPTSDDPQPIGGTGGEAGAAGQCPVMHGAPAVADAAGDRMPHPTQGGGNRGWWPNQLNLKMLAKNHPAGNPMGEDFD